MPVAVVDGGALSRVGAAHVDRRVAGVLVDEQQSVVEVEPGEVEAVRLSACRCERGEQQDDEDQGTTEHLHAFDIDASG